MLVLDWRPDPAQPEQAALAVSVAWVAGVRALCVSGLADRCGFAPDAGVSELRLARVLRSLPRTELDVSLRLDLGPGPPPGCGCRPAHPVQRTARESDGPAVRRAVLGALERLGLDRFDTVYLDVAAGPEGAAAGEPWRALRRLRAEGLVSAFGPAAPAERLAALLAGRTGAAAALLTGGRGTAPPEPLLALAAERSVALLLDGWGQADRSAHPAVAGLLVAGLPTGRLRAAVSRVQHGS
ncbi:hypothetical protein [Kitasatospora cineracea]|uniref:hypothetical protein n=1 Tax=Kitasatospora cineracea TaxID=88074 RepID=UPI0038248A60